MKATKVMSIACKALLSTLNKQLTVCVGVLMAYCVVEYSRPALFAPSVHPESKTIIVTAVGEDGTVVNHASEKVYVNAEKNTITVYKADGTNVTLPLGSTIIEQL